MSGILDSKSRIIDAILTIEGRRQMAQGDFKVSFVTFSDADVAYISDPVNGHVDPTGKIYFEACNLPQDQITFEANDEGSLVPFRSQDIKAETIGKNVVGNVAQGTLVNGRLTIYQYHHGRRVKVSTLSENSSDKGKGIVFSDISNLTGSVLIDPDIDAGKVVATAPSPGGPYKAFIGSKGGIGPQQLAIALSSSVAKLGVLGGPQVPISAVNDSAYFDGPGSTFQGTFIKPVGILSSPFQIEEGAIGGNLLTDEVENAAFASQIQGILTSSFDNFVQVQSLSTIDRLFEDQNFTLSTDEMTFDLSKTSSKMSTVLRESPPSVNVIDSLFNDKKFSHLMNFKYLPPIVKTSDTVVPDKTNVNNLKPYLLGNYPSWGDNHKPATYEQIMSDVTKYGDMKEPVVFRETSINNNVIGQVFEVNDQSVTKLDLVRFDGIKNRTLYFAGKTFIDDRGTTVFVNIFTIVFSKYDKSKEVTI